MRRAISQPGGLRLLLACRASSAAHAIQCLVPAPTVTACSPPARSFETASGKRVSGYLQYKSSKDLACCKGGDSGAGEAVCTPPAGGRACVALPSRPAVSNRHKQLRNDTLHHMACILPLPKLWLKPCSHGSTCTCA